MISSDSTFRRFYNLENTMGWSTQQLIDHEGDVDFEATKEVVETHTMKGACTECKKPFDLKFVLKDGIPQTPDGYDYRCSCGQFRIHPTMNEWSYRG